MTGKKDLANAQQQANAIAQRNARLDAKQTRKANRIAVRTANAANRQDRAQAAQLLATEKANAALLASAQQVPGETEFIDDRAAKRRRMMMGGSSPYGFTMGGGNGLGGPSTVLG